MNVYIKSFNRPYYLDRCIHSVFLNIIDDNLTVIVLDDGTNPKYLQKIKEKYPDVDIRLSPFYMDKVSKIEKFVAGGEAIKEMEIPTQFWLSNIVANNDDYFMVLEDDIWVTDKIDARGTLDLMKSHNMCMLKLFYFNNSRLISGKLKPLSEQINSIKPKLFTNNEFFFKKILLGNPFKLWSILRRFNIKNKNLVNYYTIYNVAGAIFSKKYYAYLWRDFSGKVNEHEQLIKALKFYNNEEQVTYGVVNKDLLNTSFSSSATNTFGDIDFNPFIYNDLINQSWYCGDLDTMSGYPDDILEIDIKKILEQKKHKLASVEQWEKWVGRFKEQYKEIGFSV